MLFIAELTVQVLENTALPDVNTAVVGEGGAITHQHDITDLHLADRDIHRPEALSLINLGEKIHTIAPPVVRPGVVGKEHAEVFRVEITDKRAAVLLTGLVKHAEELVHQQL